ncbi:MAG TPA: zinc metallopeptidase [Candidatus Hydrogenedentes bacterium]|nr:zinc metallopeptidase [Candidatus Hydrogenedentota bacterium]HQH52044.1 zinc metallopeptidase [Candidatus Hydrogenedentota bacterium]
MFPMFHDPTFILVIPALLFAVWAQWKVKSTYAKYARVGNRQGLTGAEVAQRILLDANVGVAGTGWGRGDGVALEPIEGTLTDHYDPRARTLRLSQDIYYGQSVAALGIAAHEVGHAIQHAHGYAPMMARNFVYPVSAIGSTLAFPIFVIGMFLGPGTGQTIMQIGILLFAAALGFTVLTLPVEFNASRRAMKALASGGYLSEDELGGARKVLTAAAMTYVASTAMAILQLVRMLLLANRR